MSNRYRDRDRGLPSAPPPPSFNERRRLESDNEKKSDKDGDKGQPPQKIVKVQPPMTFINVENASIEIIEHFDAGKEIIERYFTEQLTHIAIDCEGLDLGQYGTLTLVQISLDEKTAFIFDILHCRSLMELLKPIIESKSIVKIIHDGRSDRANLKQFGITMNNIFDTQVAYKYILKGDKREIGFNNLCQELNVGANSLKGSIKYNSWKLKRYWMNRPLTDAMIRSPEDRRRFDGNDRQYSHNIDYSRRRSPFENREGAVLDKYNREPELQQKPSSRPSVSMITSPAQIIRTILDADTVKIPRRIGEGAKPIFERAELAEGIKLRMNSNDIDLNPQLPPIYEQQKHEQPRVIAIIREPPMANFQGYSDMYPQQIPIAIQQPMNFPAIAMSPPSQQRNRNNTMDMSGPPRRRTRSRSRSPPRASASGNFNRGRGHPTGNHPAPHRPDFIYKNMEDHDRRKDFSSNIRRSRTPSPRSRVRVPNPSLEKNTNSTLISRTRANFNRSRSNTPPPMPPHFRQQLIENKKRFENRFNSNDRGRGRGGFSGRGKPGGYLREWDRDRSPRPSGSTWMHDKYENATESK